MSDMEPAGRGERGGRDRATLKQLCARWRYGGEEDGIVTVSCMDGSGIETWRRIAGKGPDALYEMVDFSG